MYGGARDQETICAISTPPGFGGISIIRISGSRALEVIQFLPSIKESSVISHKAYFSNFVSLDHLIIDEVIATFYIAPKSFTGENVVEISCHGNPYICQEILNNLVSTNFLIALPGEFSYRAFMNERLDLVQAESILDIIESKSLEASKLAMKQLKGSLSERLVIIEDKIIWVLAHLEASIDFSTEGLDVISNDEAIRKLIDVESDLLALVKSFTSGKIIRDGFDVALIGSPNVGKSSILNLILEDDRAIVTDIPGTTRDLIKADVLFNGLKYNFVDTAGIRESNDFVEKIGIERSVAQSKESHYNLFIFDLSRPLSDFDFTYILKHDFEKMFFVFNKLDLNSNVVLLEIYQHFLNATQISSSVISFDSFQGKSLLISANDPIYRDIVLNKIASVASVHITPDSAIVINSRHFQNLSHSLAKVSESLNILKQDLGSEFVALTLREALLFILSTLGKSYDDQILDKVFKEFCIGK